MVKRYIIWVYIIGAMVVLSMIAYLYVSFSMKEKDIKEQMISSQIKAINIQKEKLDNFIQEVCQQQKATKYCLLGRPQELKRLNQLLSMTINQNVKNAFLVFRGKKGRYRFLADGADMPARPMQKIDPDLKQNWDEAYLHTKQSKIISSHQKSDGLWLTYLSPFVENEQSHLMLVTDFAISLDETINQTILPVKRLLLYILALTSFLFIFALVQVYMFLNARRQSHTDSLTGMYNRNYLRKLINEQFPFTDYALVLGDIDHFKKINDEYGHTVGDQVLKEMAGLFLPLCKRPNFGFRYGGEEFLFLVDKNKVHILTEQLMQRVRSFQLDSEGSQIKFTISLGINMTLNKQLPFTDMIHRADQALYHAKSTGRNKIIFYHPEIEDKACDK